jgi:hypothetical protein
MEKLGANYFKNLAVQQGKKLASVPLKDKSAAKLLTSDNSIDCYIVKDGSIVGGRGFRSKENFENNAAYLLQKIQKIAADGVDVISEWGDSLFKNAKDL